jgi:hypothetical protein
VECLKAHFDGESNMTRHSITALLWLSFTAPVGAQPYPAGPGTTPVGPAPVLGGAPITIQVLAGKPPVGFFKSGSVLVGENGYYPFDTGAYALGGYDGLTRQYGSFVMVPPGSAGVPGASLPAFADYPIMTAPAHGRLFHRR